MQLSRSGPWTAGSAVTSARSNWCAETTLPLQSRPSPACPPARCSARSWQNNSSLNRRFTMSRHWQRVSKPVQKLAAGLHPVMSEGMSPYEIYYVLATDEEIQRLNELSTAIAVH